MSAPNWELWSKERQHEYMMNESNMAKSELAPAACSDDQRLIMVKAPDDHVIKKYDSIDEPCWTPRGTVFAPSLACNVPDAIGKLAREYNAVGRQVWTGKMMTVRGGKIIRQNNEGQP